MGGKVALFGYVVAEGWNVVSFATMIVCEYRGLHGDYYGSSRWCDHYKGAFLYRIGKVHPCILEILLQTYS
jgi:hypothetical protein